MGNVTIKKEKYQLPDGRAFRVLNGEFIQEQMFSLRSNSLYAPATEGIMSIKDFDQPFSDALISVFWGTTRNHFWRTGDYGFYPKGFEKKDLPIGEKIVWVETDAIIYTLSVPDVPVKLANGKTVGLRQAVGMGVIRLEKLKIDQTDEKAFTVSVTDDFDPVIDLKVKNIMRPRGWALVDADGYPLKSKPSHIEVPEARYSVVWHEDELDRFHNGSNGYHGSVDWNMMGMVSESCDGREVGACTEWYYESGVALFKREAVIK